MGKKNWGNRFLDVLRKRRVRNKTEYYTDTGRTRQAPVGAPGSVVEDELNEILKKVYVQAAEKQMHQSSHIYSQHIKQHQQVMHQQVMQQQADAARQIRDLYTTSQHFSTAAPPAWSQNRFNPPRQAVFGQQGFNPMDADSDKRDSEERNTGRYIVIECQITPTDENSSV